MQCQVDQAVDLLLGDDQGGREHHAVAAGAHHQTLVETVVAAKGSHIQIGGEEPGLVLVLHQRHAGHETDPLHMADQRVSADSLAQLLLEVGTDAAAHPLHNALFTQNAQIFQGHGRRPPGWPE